ncbi:MAG: hydroxypyruvate isomerase [Bradyrhizobium sp.]|nr:MAG: hydroxypyruvate isomerase [Bradyrhizobium sp.]
MAKFSANLSMLFTERPFLDRFSAAARAGFRGVEYMSPYGYPAREIAARLRDNGLNQVLFNLPVGDWERGDRGYACQPDRVEEFREGVARAVDYALALGCPTVNCLAGIPSPRSTISETHRALVDNLHYAADRLGAAGVLLVIEPVNRFDMPSFAITRSDRALDIIDETGSSNIKLQYDVYHMQRMEGDLATTIERLLPRIGHVQIAGNPGRNEPNFGEINYRFLIERLDILGYDGWVGAEYHPRGRTEDGLSWFSAYRTKGEG